MKSVTSAPFCSSKALVPRVVAKCMCMGGRAWPVGVSVAIRAARIGASTSKAISIPSPSVVSSGSGLPSRSWVEESWAVISIGALGLLRRRNCWASAKPAMSGWARSTSISVGVWMAVSVPRRQLLERTLKRRICPCGSAARQSVKVPPVSTHACQF